jgi:hypothetical protein
MTQLSRPSLATGGAIRPIEDPINLARHDKIVLVQPLIFLVRSEMVA